MSSWRSSARRESALLVSTPASHSATSARSRSTTSIDPSCASKLDSPARRSGSSDRSATLIGSLTAAIGAFGLRVIDCFRCEPSPDDPDASVRDEGGHVLRRGQPCLDGQGGDRRCRESEQELRFDLAEIVPRSSPNGRYALAPDESTMGVEIRCNRRRKGLFPWRNPL